MHGHFISFIEKIKPKRKAQKGTLAFFTGMLFLSAFLVFVLGNYAYHQAEIVCPHEFAEPPTDIVSYLWAMITIFLNPCSGLPPWVYIFIFLPVAAAIVVYLTPFIGG